MDRVWFLPLLLLTLVLPSSGVAAQPDRIAASSLTTDDLGKEFAEVMVHGVSGFGHDGLVDPPQDGSLLTYTAFFERDEAAAPATGGPLLVGNVIGGGGPSDLDRILVFFLTSSPVPPPAPFVAPIDGPAIRDDWRWIAFPARVLEPGLRVPIGQVLDVHAVAFRTADRMALVMAAGQPSTVTQEGTFLLAQLVADRLAVRP